MHMALYVNSHANVGVQMISLQTGHSLKNEISGLRHLLALILLLYLQDAMSNLRLPYGVYLSSIFCFCRHLTKELS